MARASEGGHWYAPDGTPVFEVPKANGKGMTKATLRHARKLGLVPGVTTIIGELFSWPLVNYFKDQVVEAAAENPIKPGESLADYRARILPIAEEHARQAAERGTQIHAHVQDFYETGDLPADEGARKTVEAVQAELHSRCGPLVWDAERAFACHLGYGSKADLSHPDKWVIDFKTKDFDSLSEEKKLVLYDNHYMQLAATRYGLGYHKASCAIVFISRTTPGLCAFVPAKDDELERGFSMFRGLLGVWQDRNKHYCGWEPRKEAV